MKEEEAQSTDRRQSGTVIVFVLWVLALITFLAGDYAGRRRQDADLALNAWRNVQRREAVLSVVDLVAVAGWPLPGEVQGPCDWLRLNPAQISTWVRVSDENSRININTAPDETIRQFILSLTEDMEDVDGERISDALLDWRDTDRFVRLKGAEEGDYDLESFQAVPADGPFKVLTEMLLVAGVRPDLFWGDPWSDLRGSGDWVSEDGVEETERTEESRSLPISLVDGLTVYSGRVRRLELIIPGQGGAYWYVLAFLEPSQKPWKIVGIYQTSLRSKTEEGEEPSGR